MQQKYNKMLQKDIDNEGRGRFGKTDRKIW